MMATVQMLIAKNNILVNTRDECTLIALRAIYDYVMLQTSHQIIMIFIIEPNQYNCIVRIGDTNYNTLADWQATGKDLNSVSEMPHFTAPDLHI